MVGATPALAEASAAAGVACSGPGAAGLLPLLAEPGSLLQIQLTLERLRLVSLVPCCLLGLAPSNASFVFYKTGSDEALLPVVHHR
jgi:hypothetical protein